MNKKSSVIKNIYLLLMTAAVLAVPLFPKFPFISIPGSSVAIRLEDFLLLFISIILAFLYYPRLKDILREPVHRAIAVYLAVTLLSLISALLITGTAVPLVGLLHWIRRVEYFIPFFLGFLLLSYNKDGIDYTIKLLLIVVFFVFIYGLGQKYFDWPMIVTQNTEYAKGVALRWSPGSHLNSTFAGHYDLATFLVLIMPTIILCFFTLKGKITKITMFFAFIFCLWLLVNTASRISLASYLLSATLGLILVRKYIAIPVVVLVSVVFIFFSSNLQSRYTHLFDVIREKIQPGITYSLSVKQVYAADNELQIGRVLPSPTPTPIPVIEDRSTSIRLNIEWPRALHALAKNPLLGTGFSSITLATDNDYLRALGESGILGLMALILILLRIIIIVLNKFPLYKNLKGIQLAFVAGIISAYPGVLLNGMFIDVFEASKFAIMFWFLTGVLIGSLYEKNSKNI